MRESPRKLRRSFGIVMYHSRQNSIRIRVALIAFEQGHPQETTPLHWSVPGRGGNAQRSKDIGLTGFSPGIQAAQILVSPEFELAKNLVPDGSWHGNSAQALQQPPRFDRLSRGGRYQPFCYGNRFQDLSSAQPAGLCEPFCLVLALMRLESAKTEPLHHLPCHSCPDTCPVALDSAYNQGCAAGCCYTKYFGHSMIDGQQM